MVDWNDGKPNPRFRVLQLLHDNFGPGDKIVDIASPAPGTPSNPYIYSLAFIKKDGKRRVLLVNKRDRGFQISVPGASGGELEYVDQNTGFVPPKVIRLDSDTITVNGFGVAALTLPRGTN
jgi:hypothetical protein